MTPAERRHPLKVMTEHREVAREKMIASWRDEKGWKEFTAGLKEAIEAGYVRETLFKNGKGLALYCYTQKCTFEKAWNPITRSCRGLIIDWLNDEIVALPFPKFFNLGENQENLPIDQGFKIYEKVDGSLIIIYYYDGAWRTATKGSFSSSQAIWASQWLTPEVCQLLSPGTTYLFEAIYPENRIVIGYDTPQMVLLGAYDEEGFEWEREELADEAFFLDQAQKTPAVWWRVPEEFYYESIAHLVEAAGKLPGHHEGWVVRFENGQRVKIKGDEYCRIHKLISRVTPLAVWEALYAGDDLNTWKQQLPEEFYGDFDGIVDILAKQFTQIFIPGEAKHFEMINWSDKDVGLELKDDQAMLSLVFAFRKTPDKISKIILRRIRPDGNELEGYQPTSSMRRVMEEAL